MRDIDARAYGFLLQPVVLLIGYVLLVRDKVPRKKRFVHLGFFNWVSTFTQVSGGNCLVLMVTTQVARVVTVGFDCACDTLVCGC